MFSFDTKREPEKCQRFRRAGATKKGLLAPFNPKEVGCTGKNCRFTPVRREDLLTVFSGFADLKPLSRCATAPPGGASTRPQRRAFAESGAANAVSLHDPSREKVNRENPQIFPIYKSQIIFPLNMRSNDDDRRQWRKQGGVVGAAASKTQVPPKARCGCWVPQPGRRGAHSNRLTPHQK